jgi:hypothetical protein
VPAGAGVRSHPDLSRRPRDATTAGLEPDIHQREIGRTGQQQRDRKGHLRALAEGMEVRFHGGKHPAILGEESRGFFFSPLTSR